MTFGYEIEWGNIDKGKEIPKELGYWEGNGKHCEIDILNKIDGQWIASSPKNPLGGEINMTPQSSIKELSYNFNELQKLFPEAVVAPISHGHVHIREKWIKDVEKLKDWTKWASSHYEEIIKECYTTPTLSKDLCNGIRYYLKWDGGRKFTSSTLAKIEQATTLEEIMDADRRGKTTMRFSRPFINIRAINTSGTIEFRCFRMPYTVEEFQNQLIFAEGLMNKTVIKGLNLPKFDPEGLTNSSEGIQALNDSYVTRDIRKKEGKKIRLEWR
jgi:hypothetical protein